MIEDILLDKKYYLSKMSMFLKESYGVLGTTDLMLDWMKSVNSVSEYILNTLDIWNENYKEDMIEKFGFKYFYRTLDETNTYLRGHFSSNNGRFYISNVSLTDPDGIEYEVENGSADTKTFYAVRRSEDTSFAQEDKYFDIEISSNYELTKIPVSPANLNLYEKPNKVFIPSSDTEFIESKIYYIQEDIGNGQYKYIQANPKNLNLYEGDIYKVKYEETSDFNETSPFALNLVHGFEEIVQETSFNNEQVIKMTIDGNTVYRIATPQNCNNGGILYEKIDNELFPTLDEIFVANKHYYKDLNTEATPVNCGLYQPQKAVAGDVFKDYQTWYFLYQSTYTEANQYNTFFNLYHIGLNYTQSKDYVFTGGGEYYIYNPDRLYTGNLANKIDSSITPSIIGFEKFYNENGEEIQNPLPFDPSKKYYADDKTKNRLFPINLKLLERHLTNDLSFVTGKNYYIFDNGEYVVISPFYLHLYEESAATQSGYIETEDTEFNPSKIYFIETTDDNNNTIYKQATPQNCNNGGALYEEFYSFSKDTDFISGKPYYYLLSVSPVSLGLYENGLGGKIESHDTSFQAGKNYYQTVDSYFPTNPTLLNLYEKSSSEILSSSTEGNAFIFETYYINQSFIYSKRNANATSFGPEMALIKEDSEYTSQNSLKEEFGTGSDFKFLDIIASIVGCSRLNKIKYEVEEGVWKEETLDLSNEDLLDLIKIKIIQNNYKGTLRELIDLYKDKLNYKIYISLIPVSIEHSTNTDFPSYVSAACNVFLEEIKTVNNEAVSPNMQKLFLYSDMFIQSLGIQYNKTVVPNIDNILWLDRDYAFKNEMAIYDEAYRGEIEKRNTSTRLG